MAGKLGRASAKRTPKPRASRKKNGSATVTAAPDISETEIQQLVQECIDADGETETAKRAYDSKKSSYRAKVKIAAKKSGYSVDSITKLVAFKKRDPQEITREFDELNRIMRLMKLPVGTQLGLDLGGKSIATAIEDDKQAEAEELSALDQKAVDDGYAAGEAGVPDTKNPYEEGTPRHELWATYWGKAQHAKLATIGRGKGAKAEARPN